MKKITLYCLVLFAFIVNNSIANTDTTNSSSVSNNTSTLIQRVRIAFVSPNGYTRHLLLGFTPNDAATDGYDYGYDGLNADSFPNDLNWLIEDDRYVTQGVGSFDETKQYPLGLFLADSGNIEITLTSLENFDSTINVFIYDKLLDTYTQINNSDYVISITNGEYLNRFYIAFLNTNDTNNILATNENELETSVIKYLSNSKEIYVNTANQNNIKQLHIYNLTGQKVTSIGNIHKTEIKLPVNYLTTNYAILNIETEFGTISKKIIIH